ncbi:hypothetical protein WME89_09745 [Sorangium sp. So ce321]|uniref:hypothetical protein n=1 Tax=Sorangium sp. So ce321 TaxID=3133300 RepID=UPI003F5DB6C0
MAIEPASNPNIAKERTDLIRTLSLFHAHTRPARLRPPFAVPALAVLDPSPDQPRAPRRYPEAGIFSTAPAEEPEMDAPLGGRSSLPASLPRCLAAIAGETPHHRRIEPTGDPGVERALPASARHTRRIRHFCREEKYLAIRHRPPRSRLGRRESS